MNAVLLQRLVGELLFGLQRLYNVLRSKILFLVPHVKVVFLTGISSSLYGHSCL